MDHASDPLSTLGPREAALAPLVLLGGTDLCRDRASDAVTAMGWIRDRALTLVLLAMFHGSRFTPTGAVISGAAEAPLSEAD